MKVKITDKILCIPPYVSTTWDHVSSLQVETSASDDSKTLLVFLNEGYCVKIPHLDPSVIQSVFAAHLKYLENKTEARSPEKEPSFAKKIPPGAEEAFLGSGLPFRFGSIGIDGLGAVMQHNPDQSDTPSLPAEILNKIAAVSKIVGSEEINLIPQPEKGCNCVFCQIARVIHNEAGSLQSHEEIEEEVSDEDLKFKLWDIIQTGDKLYSVTNPLDSNEHYSVYLGEPIGCTCGQKNCEHIHAVLNEPF